MFSNHYGNIDESYLPLIPPIWKDILLTDMIHLKDGDPDSTFQKNMDPDS